MAGLALGGPFQQGWAAQEEVEAEASAQAVTEDVDPAEQADGEGAAVPEPEEPGADADMGPAEDGEAAEEGEGAGTEETGTDLPSADGQTLPEEPAAEMSEPLEASQPSPGPSRLQPLLDLVEAGGPVIVLLAVLSVLSLMVIIVKLIQFTFLRVGDYRFAERIGELLQAGRDDEALASVSKRSGVVARVMEAAIRGFVVGGRDPAVKDEVERVAKAKLDGLERGLPLLSLIATISPLLGLLGTVLGMIEAFQQLETAGDRVDPAILSGGIWEALLTTAAGLSVAIPAAAFYTWLQRSVDVAAQHMEDVAIRVFTAKLYSAGADEASAAE